MFLGSLVSCGDFFGGLGKVQDFFFQNHSQLAPLIIKLCEFFSAITTKGTGLLNSTVHTFLMFM